MLLIQVILSQVVVKVPVPVALIAANSVVKDKLWNQFV